MRRIVFQSLLAAVFVSGIGATGQAVEPDILARYAACKMPDGLEVVETAPLAPGVHRRPVQTIHGEQMITMEAGKRVMFAYPGEDFYANLKAERLPSATYAEEKQILIEDFDHTLAASTASSRNYSLKPKLNGFSIYGLDREKREGGVLGIYLLFDDNRHDAITIYFLNQEPPTRFQTMEQYGKLRDSFLQAYTSCLATQ